MAGVLGSIDRSGVLESHLDVLSIFVNRLSFFTGRPRDPTRRLLVSSWRSCRFSRTSTRSNYTSWGFVVDVLSFFVNVYAN